MTGRDVITLPLGDSMSVRSIFSRSFGRTLFAGSSLAVIALMAAPAQAAEPAAAPVQAADQANENDDALPPITVTATRREELSKDVPLAVTSLSGATLDTINSSGLDIRFLSGRTPSLNIESSFGRTFPRFYIRGLGNTDFDPNAAQPVSVVYDDVALESPFLKSFPVFDLADVQVLRGPQGTLFGRNTPAGVVKLTSAKPRDVWSGYATVSWGTYDTVNSEAAIGGPLGGGFSFRASGLIQRRDNWITNTSTTGNANRNLEGYTDKAGRFQLAYSGVDFNALVNVHGRQLDGTPRVFRAGLFSRGSNNFSAGFRPDRVALDGYTSQELDQWGINLKLDYKVDGIGTFYTVTAYERATVESTGDIDGGNRYVFPALGLNNSLFPVNTGGETRPTEFSQEIRFASEEFGQFRAQGGLYYFNQQLNYDEFNYNFPTTGSRSRDLNSFIRHNNSNENYGVFASVEYKATEKFTLRAGGRYSHDDRDDLVTDLTRGGSGITFGLPLPIRTLTNDGEFTWDVSGTYALTPDVNIYARAATGYQGPAIQDRVTFGSRPTTAPKQTTISGEFGIKGSTTDRRLSFAADAYYFSTDDLQVTAVGGASNSTRLLSAANAIGYGVEAEFQARPVPQLTLTASGSYNFTEIRDPNLRVGVCGAMCTVTDPTVMLAGQRVAIINGNDLPQAPRFVANWTARYAVPFRDGEIYLFTDWAYRSAVNIFLYEAVEFRGRSLLEGGVKLAYKVNDTVEFGIFARNITNQIRATGAIDFNNLTGFINDPRIIGGHIRVGF